MGIHFIVSALLYGYVHACYFDIFFKSSRYLMSPLFSLSDESIVTFNFSSIRSTKVPPPPPPPPPSSLSFSLFGFDSVLSGVRSRGLLNMDKMLPGRPLVRLSTRGKGVRSIGLE